MADVWVDDEEIPCALFYTHFPVQPTQGNNLLVSLAFQFLALMVLCQRQGWMSDLIFDEGQTEYQ